jgi:glyoxylase-like metal-dependent hydrolase (beta-lactamase superfamily II)
MQRRLAEGLATPRSKWVTMPLPAFLVEHPTAGPFMIDTGVSASHASDGGRGDLGRVGGAILGATMTPQMAAGAQVRALGHDPEQIPLVVMTHLHFDHLGGSDQFPGAEFLVAKTEWSDPPSSTKGTYGHHRDAGPTLAAARRHGVGRASRTTACRARGTSSVTARCSWRGRPATRPATCRSSCACVAGARRS